MVAPRVRLVMAPQDLHRRPMRPVHCEDLGLHAALHSIIHNHAGGGEWWHLVFV